MATLSFSSVETEEEVRETLRAMDDDSIQAQHLVQQGAISVLMLLDREGCSPEHVRSLLETGIRVGAIVTVECHRRGLTTVDMPGTH